MKHLRKLGSQAGFTLVELIVSITVLTLVSAGVVSFTVSKTIQTARDTTRADLLNDAQIGLDHMANDIRLSSKADDANRWADVNGPVSGNNYSWQSTSNSLILATSAQDNSGNILFDDHADYITTKNNFIYFLKSGTLYKRILAAPATGNSAKTTCPTANATCPADKTVLTNVSSISIQYYDTLNQQVDPASARSIQLNVQLKETSFGQPITADYKTRMVFRNG